MVDYKVAAWSCWMWQNMGVWMLHKRQHARMSFRHSVQHSAQPSASAAWPRSTHCLSRAAPSRISAALPLACTGSGLLTYRTSGVLPCMHARYYGKGYALAEAGGRCSACQNTQLADVRKSHMRTSWRCVLLPLTGAGAVTVAGGDAERRRRSPASKLPCWPAPRTSMSRPRPGARLSCSCAIRHAAHSIRGCCKLCTVQ